MATQLILYGNQFVQGEDGRVKAAREGEDCTICGCDEEPTDLWYELVPCADQDGASLDLIISQTLFTLVGGAGAVVRVGLYCYTVGGAVDPTGRTSTGIFTGYATCEDCTEATFPCVPDNTEDLTDEQIEATYPDIGFKFPDLEWCPTFNLTFPTEVKTFTDNGLAGHEYMMEGGAINRQVDGHCRSYSYGTINWPFNGLTGDLEIGSETHPPDPPDPPESADDYYQVDSQITLCCSEADGWQYSGASAVLQVNAFVFFQRAIANPGGPWDGASSPITTDDNDEVKDVDCESNGIGSDNAGGGGRVEWYPHAPGI